MAKYRITLLPEIFEVDMSDIEVSDRIPEYTRIIIKKLLDREWGMKIEKLED